MNFHITQKSTNRKVGKIPVTTSAKETCPDNCPLKGAGCYADGGPLNIHWDKVSNGERGVTFEEFLEAIRKLPEGQLWRHNQAGDLVPYKEHQDKIMQSALGHIVGANLGKRGFTYTHYPVLEGRYAAWNRKRIKEANEEGFTVNLSGDSPSHADKLADLNIGPVTTSLPSSWESRTTGKTPAGRKIVVCPAVRKADKSCANCGLCQKVDREYIIGFPAHGFRTRNMDRMIAAMEAA
jgi:hypothetical protein